MRALADVSLTRGGERQRAQGAVLIRAPRSVRLEALSPFGPPLMVLTVRDGQITTYNALKNEAMVGPADSETISKVLRLQLEPDDLVSVLAGRFAGPRDLRSAEVLPPDSTGPSVRSEEHTSELQSLRHLVCRLLLAKKKTSSSC